MFRRCPAVDESGPVYCCQTDGMLGLGCGARSYTQSLHYSYEYAVGSKAVRGILNDYISRDSHSFSNVDYGFRLDDDDQRRRHLIMSLLQCEGMISSDYVARFGTKPVEDFPMLLDLVDSGLMRITDERIELSESGIEYSDAIGPWLNSATVRKLEASYQWR
jgi:oxygen-independent coproporphyrinogen-3 oxidase